MNATSTPAKAAKAHSRMKHIMHRSQEKPWMTWIAVGIVLAPFILLLVLGLTGF